MEVLNGWIYDVDESIVDSCQLELVRGRSHFQNSSPRVRSVELLWSVYVLPFTNLTLDGAQVFMQWFLNQSEYQQGR